VTAAPRRGASGRQGGRRRCDIVCTGRASQIDSGFELSRYVQLRQVRTIARRMLQQPALKAFTTVPTRNTARTAVRAGRIAAAVCRSGTGHQLRHRFQRLLLQPVRRPCTPRKGDRTHPPTLRRVILVRASRSGFIVSACSALRVRLATCDSEGARWCNGFSGPRSRDDPSEKRKGRRLPFASTNDV